MHDWKVLIRCMIIESLMLGIQIDKQSSVLPFYLHNHPSHSSMFPAFSKIVILAAVLSCLHDHVVASSPPSPIFGKIQRNTGRSRYKSRSQTVLEAGSKTTRPLSKEELENFAKRASRRVSFHHAMNSEEVSQRTHSGNFEDSVQSSQSYASPDLFHPGYHPFLEESPGSESNDTDGNFYEAFGNLRLDSGQRPEAMHDNLRVGDKSGSSSRKKTRDPVREEVRMIEYNPSSEIGGNKAPDQGSSRSARQKPTKKGNKNPGRFHNPFLVWDQLAEGDQMKLLRLMFEKRGIELSDSLDVLKRNLTEEQKISLFSDDKEEVEAAIWTLFEDYKVRHYWMSTVGPAKGKHLIRQAVRASRAPEDQIEAFFEICDLQPETVEALLKYDDFGADLFGKAAGMIMLQDRQEKEKEEYAAAYGTEYARKDVVSGDKPWSYRISPTEQEFVVRTLMMMNDVSSYDAIERSLESPHIFPGYGYAFISMPSERQWLVSWLYINAISVKRQRERHQHRMDLKHEKEKEKQEKGAMKQKQQVSQQQRDIRNAVPQDPNMMQHAPPYMQQGLSMPQYGHYQAPPQYRPPPPNPMQFPSNEYQQQYDPYYPHHFQQ
jgi:hypothetical protein